MDRKYLSVFLVFTVFFIFGCSKKENLAENYIKSGNSKMAQGNFQGAIGEYTKAIEADSQFKSAYYNRGQAETTLGKYNQAIDDYSKAVELDSKYGTYYFARGMAMFALKNYQGAISDFTNAILFKLSEHTAEAYCGRGESIVLNQSASFYVGKQLSEEEIKTIQEAIRDFTFAIELKSNFAEAYAGRGMAKNILQDYGAALLDLNKSLELNPNFGQAYAGRGLTKIRSGNKSEGCLDLKKAEELGYSEAIGQIKLFCK